MSKISMEKLIDSKSFSDILPNDFTRSSQLAETCLTRIPARVTLRLMEGNLQSRDASASINLQAWLPVLRILNMWDLGFGIFGCDIFGFVFGIWSFEFGMLGLNQIICEEIQSWQSTVNLVSAKELVEQSSNSKQTPIFAVCFSSKKKLTNTLVWKNHAIPTTCLTMFP